MTINDSTCHEGSHSPLMCHTTLGLQMIQILKYFFKHFQFYYLYTIIEP